MTKKVQEYSKRFDIMQKEQTKEIIFGKLYDKAESPSKRTAVKMKPARTLEPLLSTKN